MPPARRVVAVLATVCFAGAVALTPAEVRSRLQPAPQVDALPPAAVPPPLAPVVPAGDPFVARAADDPAPAAAAAPAALPALGVPPALAPRGPANPVVRAIVTGDRPSALVDDGTATHLVGPGDRFAGATVTVIDATGVALDDGRRFSLPAGGETLR